MQKRPALTLSQHNAFSASEEKLRALPGVSLDLHNGEEDEVWLQLERLHETKPPAPLSPLLALWIELKGTPQTEPVLKVRLAREVLINSTAISEDERSRLMPVALQIGEDVDVFFKQKTAYGMTDCDWSSDVCSSDLSGQRSQFFFAGTESVVLAES